VPGDIGFDPLKIKPTNAAELKSIQLKEINNGRLAMIGLFSLISASKIPGSVPSLDFIQSYSGEYMAPFNF